MGRIRQADDELRRIFGRGLRRVREFREMKQEALAERVGYGGHSQIAKIENGQAVPSFGQAIRLATVLQVTLEAVIHAGQGEIEDMDLSRVVEPAIGLLVVQYQQVKMKAGELFQAMDRLEALLIIADPVVPDELPPYSKTPGSGLICFKPLDEIPDFRLLACA